jgi:Protein of Unknown function (DUF2784)
VEYRLGIAVVVAVHYLYLGYLVTGGFLAWRWRRTIWLHIATAAWAVVISIAPVACPLTWLHDWLRHRLGEPGLRQGFIAHYVTGVLYPARAETAVRGAVAAVVVASWLGYVLIRGWESPAPGMTRVRRTP